MAVIYLLGPGFWETSKSPKPAQTPLDIRRQIARVFEADGHRVIIMEDDPVRKGEDLIEKFDRLLHRNSTHVVFYWPPKAKMQTTFDEFLHLYRNQQFLRTKSIPIWVVHHVSVAEIKRDEFRLLEEGGRSRYLEAVTKLGMNPLEWDDEVELFEKIRLLSKEIDM
jgi:hypothetical protein